MKIIHFSKVEVSLFVLLLLFGVPMIVLIPPGAGYDEEDHLVRVWELSAFSIIPGQLSSQELRYPTVFGDFAYRQQGSTGVIDADFWKSYGRAGLYERGFVRREIDTKSVYSPILLIPQAIAMGIFGRRAGLPALPVFFLCRLAGLLSYLTLTWIAVRQMPSGKWILLLLAVSPMALFQAATITPDAISNGIGFLFIAGCLQVAQNQNIGWKETGCLVILIFLLFFAKLNLVPLVLLPVLLILPSRFAPGRLYFLLPAAALVLFLTEVVGWNLIASSNFNSLLTNDADLAAQLLHIWRHPLTFLQIILRDFLANGWTYFQGWINGYGYYYWTPPLIVSILFLVSLGSALLVDRTFDQASGRFSMVFILVFLGGYLATILSLYTSFTPVGSEQILGVQGRYFIPLALPLFLALSALPAKGTNLATLSPRWMMIFLAAALSLNILGIFFSFHVPCGSTFYQTGLCYRPLFRDFPDEVRPSAPLSDGASLVQGIRITCDGLAEVRLLPVSSTTGAGGTTHFILKDSVSDQTLLDASVVNDQIRAEDWYPLRFEPDWNSARKGYVLKIAAVNTSLDQGLRFLLTPQPEFNLGDTSENGQSIEQDLVLQYGCVTGLRKMWLTGRP